MKLTIMKIDPAEEMIMKDKNQEKGTIQENLVQDAEEEMVLKIAVIIEARVEMDITEARVVKDGMKLETQDPDQDQVSGME